MYSMDEALTKLAGIRSVQVLGLYTILFYFEAFVHESIILSLPPATCIARTIVMLVHVYRAIYDASPTPHLYTMHNTILAMAISCKGQTCARIHIRRTCSPTKAVPPYEPG